MGTIKLRTLDDYARYDADVQVTCRKCGRVALFDANTLIQYFRAKNWNRSLEVAALKFHCRGPAGSGEGCGSKDVQVRARAKPDPAAPPPIPEPVLPAPLGVDPLAWSKAKSENERKRLIRQARG